MRLPEPGDTPVTARHVSTPAVRLLEAGDTPVTTRHVSTPAVRLPEPGDTPVTARHVCTPAARLAEAGGAATPPGRPGAPHRLHRGLAVEPVAQPVDAAHPAVVHGAARRRVLVTLERDQTQVTLDDLAARTTRRPGSTRPPGAAPARQRAHGSGAPRTRSTW